MKLSEQIKKYRKENNLTQEQFASKLFVSKQAVSKWETNRSYPDINLLPQIAEMLNISIDELIGKKETENSTNNQEKIIKKNGLFVNLELKKIDKKINKLKTQKIDNI